MKKKFAPLKSKLEKIIGIEKHAGKVRKCYYFSKRKWKYFYTFNHSYSEKSSKRAKEHKSTTVTPNLPE